MRLAFDVKVFKKFNKVNIDLKVRWAINLTQFHQLCQGEWTRTPAIHWEKLLEGNPKGLTQVIQSDIKDNYP
uniref:Uncharacterized protein n=1 Tax=Poecilia latipinna TaxID=48699 RepID=A0A3B3VR59_9TELE